MLSCLLKTTGTRNPDGMNAAILPGKFLKLMEDD